MPSSQSAPKLLHLEFLRIFAIILVIYNHTGTFVIPRGEIGGMADWLIYFGSTTCKVAVPLFFMISGALLLGRQEDYTTLYRKRVWRFFVVLAAFIFIQHLWKVIIGEYNVQPHAFVANYVHGIIREDGGNASVTWFLYAYLMLLVFLPFIRALAAKIQARDYLYLLILCCAMEIALKVPYGLHYGSIYFMFAHTPFMPLTKACPFTAGYGAFYMLMGFYAERHLAERMQSPAFRWGLAGVSLVCLLLSTVVLTMAQNEELMGCFLPIPTMTIYLWAKYMFVRRPAPAWYARTLCLLGGSVLVVMLTENIWRSIVADFILPRLKEPGAPYYLYLAQVLLAFTFAATLGMILKRIPVVNRYI